LDVSENTANFQAQKPPGEAMSFIVTGARISFRLPSRIEAVNEAADSVARILNNLGTSEDINFGIDMAVREAVTNAVLHGNKQDESKSVELQIVTSPEAVEILIHDQGSGFTPEDVPDPTAAENILKTSGRGIFLMRNFMDEVHWLIQPKGGTTVRLIKRL
jgi:serine/threonine-protein kinase RsbW